MPDDGKVSDESDGRWRDSSLSHRGSFEGDCDERGKGWYFEKDS